MATSTLYGAAVVQRGRVTHEISSIQENYNAEAKFFPFSTKDDIDRIVTVKFESFQGHTATGVCTLRDIQIHQGIESISASLGVGYAAVQALEIQTLNGEMAKYVRSRRHKKLYRVDK